MAGDAGGAQQLVSGLFGLGMYIAICKHVETMIPFVVSSSIPSAAAATVPAEVPVFPLVTFPIRLVKKAARVCMSASDCAPAG
jgi:hypothetical protein